MIAKLEILGLRGFAQRQTLDLAIPNGELASGLTVIVGANNAGKSTAIEALRAISQSQPPSFAQGRRNMAAGDRVEIVVTDTEGRTANLQSVRPGSSESNVVHAPVRVTLEKIFFLPSRRVFDPFFGRSQNNRDQYMQNLGFPPVRAASISQFSNRLFTIERNRAAFDVLLGKIVQPVPNWSIDQHDNGQHFLKIRKGDAVHNSEGMGEGFISLLFLVDALYDSEPGATIVIDEPELSLHPALQRRLAAVFFEFAKDRQIVLATHSPYFVPTQALQNGVVIARSYLDGAASKLSQALPGTLRRLASLLGNRNNPHILGLNAQEIFFVEDNVILFEGQEDVLFVPVVEASIGISLTGNIFGWGVGGAGNMEVIAALLRELGFRKVVGVLDSDKAVERTRLAGLFPAFNFITQPARDIRTKPAVAARPEAAGLLNDANDQVRPEYFAATRAMFDSINAYLR